MRSLPRLLLFSALVCISISGCSGSSDPDLAQLSGSVTYRGEELAGGIVEFSYDEANGNVVRRLAQIREDGTYQVVDMTPGDFRISVDTEILAGTDEYVSLPQNFLAPETSGLSLTVKPGKQEHLISIE